MPDSGLTHIQHHLQGVRLKLRVNKENAEQIWSQPCLPHLRDPTKLSGVFGVFFLCNTPGPRGQQVPWEAMARERVCAVLKNTSGEKKDRRKDNVREDDMRGEKKRWEKKRGERER